ncbi:MAG: protein DA1 [Spirochaetales bacterium]|nr:protein DA1 [Spirochaetales bacterium]
MPLLCDYCGQPLAGRFFRDFWGNSYCADHLKKAPVCSYCGRLIGEKTTGGGRAYADGRAICRLCYKSAVTDQTRGREILGEVHDRLEEMGILVRPFRPEFFLIDRSRLISLDRSGREKQGYAVFNRKTVNREITEFRLEIFILTGLPEIQFRTACAHELMHIWFYSRGITDASPALTEGSCNMAAYLILEDILTPESEYLRKSLNEDRDRIYGGGFRKARRLVEDRGIPGWLDHISKKRRF